MGISEPHGIHAVPFFPCITILRWKGKACNACLALVVRLVHSAGWMSIMHANSHPGPGEFPELWPDLRFLGPVLLHFYKDMSLTIGPADGSPPKFRDHLESEWGQIQLQGADAFQRLLEALDCASLRTQLGGLANRNWHQLGTQWSEIRMKCSIRGQCSFGYRKEEAMTTAIAMLPLCAEIGCINGLLR